MTRYECVDIIAIPGGKGMHLAPRGVVQAVQPDVPLGILEQVDEEV
jgi:hypothetical protein